jgi:hypothetical protein
MSGTSILQWAVSQTQISKMKIAYKFCCFKEGDMLGPQGFSILDGTQELKVLGEPWFHT